MWAIVCSALSTNAINAFQKMLNAQMPNANTTVYNTNVKINNKNPPKVKDVWLTNIIYFMISDAITTQNKILNRMLKIFNNFFDFSDLVESKYFIISLP